MILEVVCELIIQQMLCMVFNIIVPMVGLLSSVLELCVLCKYLLLG